MSKNLKILLYLIAIAVLILSVIWYINTKNIEPLIGIFTSVSGLLVLTFAKDGKNKKGGLKQTQRTGDNSTAQQAGRDIITK